MRFANWDGRLTLIAGASELTSADRVTIDPSRLRSPSPFVREEKAG